tara:strand:- start:3830 stop:4228 length:399 start_codon:yes stop_codon:yes gene_type:complete
MTTDPIADFLNRVRNALLAGHKVVEIPASNVKLEITRILQDQGFILNHKVEDNGPQGTIKIALKYDKVTNEAAIRSLKRISKPGLRSYHGAKDLPRVINGLGVAIISTSKGVMTDKQARKENIGGEVLCQIY